MAAKTPVIYQERPVMTQASDIAFTPSVKTVQERRGSRDGYARLEAKGGFATAIDAALVGIIAGMRSF